MTANERRRRTTAARHSPVPCGAAGRHRSDRGALRQPVVAPPCRTSEPAGKRRRCDPARVCVRAVAGARRRCRRIDERSRAGGRAPVRSLTARVRRPATLSAGPTRSDPGLRGLIPARQPADDPAQREPRLRREGEIGDHADDDSERQAQHRSERDRGSDAHTRESMRCLSARRLGADMSRCCCLHEGCRRSCLPRRGQRLAAEQWAPLPYGWSAVSAEPIA